MTSNKDNIIGKMLLGTAFKESRKKRFKAASKVMIVLITEFSYQSALAGGLKEIFACAEPKNNLKLIKSISEEIKSTKKLALSDKQKSSLYAFEKAFSAFLEDMADKLVSVKKSELALYFYEASVDFNPENFKASNKYYELWENVNNASTGFKKAAFLPDINKNSEKT